MDLKSVMYMALAVTGLVISFRLIKVAGERLDGLRKYLPALNGIQLVLWISLVFWALTEVFGKKSYYPYLLLVLVLVTAVLLVWYYLRDILTGFLFRMKHNPRLNQWMESESANGLIQHLGLTYISVQASDGQVHRIPYSTVINQTIVLRMKHDQSSGEVVLRALIPPSANPGLFEQRVRQALVTASWCVASKPIVIKPDRDEPGVMLVIFHLFDSSYHTMARERIQLVVSQFNGAIEETEK